MNESFGELTMSKAPKIPTSRGNSPIMFRPEYSTAQVETDIMGQDGHVYKGQVEGSRPPSTNM